MKYLLVQGAVFLSLWMAQDDAAAGGRHSGCQSCGNAVAGQQGCPGGVCGPMPAANLTQAQPPACPGGACVGQAYQPGSACQSGGTSAGHRGGLFHRRCR